ncbi:putative F-box/kelch-repeat protein At4g22430 [Henckelia pumila]|uniref:putative F-box/kelch-repeat protein At4g22430 n=1 Tax=Henckelia pumila TaxID=405737 RepID=UPI003C6DF864
MENIFPKVFNDKLILISNKTYFLLFRNHESETSSMDNNIDDLPDCLLAEVLLRLSPASLCRFKAVSKEWHSLISSTYFIRTYASKSPPYWAFLSVFEHDNCMINSAVREHKLLIDLHSGDLKCPSPSPISNNHRQKLHMEFYKVLGVSNGLILCWCSMYNSRDYKYSCSYPIVCNPVTKQYVILPPCISFASYKTISGWGFLTEMRDGVVTSYTVVVPVASRLRFQVFSSKTGEWKVYYPMPANADSEIFRRGRSWGNATELDGILHWVHPIKGIFAYDPHRNPKALRLIALPNRHLVHDFMCSTHQGHLKYLELDHTQNLISVWVLNDYGMGDNWSLEHRVDCGDILRDVQYYCIHVLDLNIKLKLISLHPFDPDIVYFGCDYVFASYNMRERNCKFSGVFRLLSRGQSFSIGGVGHLH